jgi:hypothetical protein
VTTRTRTRLIVWITAAVGALCAAGVIYVWWTFQHPTSGMVERYLSSTFHLDSADCRQAPVHTFTCTVVWRGCKVTGRVADDGTDYPWMGMQGNPLARCTGFREP